MFVYDRILTVAGIFRVRELLLGELIIDQQHEQVLDRLDEVRTSVELRRPPAETSALLTAFLETVEWHFASECDLMRANQYPDEAAHRGEHKRLLKELKQANAEFNDGKLQAGGALAVFVQLWTSEHIHGPGRRFVEYPRRRANREAAGHEALSSAG